MSDSRNFFDELQNEFSPQNSIIISNQPEINSTPFKNYTPPVFFEYILRKNPSFAYPKTLSKQAGSYILQTIIKKTFKENTALFNLTKSNSFSKDLYDLYEKFSVCNFTENDLCAALDTIEASTEDYNRLKIIFSTCKIYLDKLKELNYVQKSALSKLVKKLLTENTTYLKTLSETFQNLIILGKEEEYSQNDWEVFNLFPKIKILQLKTYKNRHACALLTDKFISPAQPSTVENNDLRLLNFNDIRDSVGFIAEEIQEKIKQENAKPADFVIAVPNKETSAIVKEIFNLKEIPNDLPDKNSDYKEFIAQLSRYLTICNRLVLLEQTDSKAEAEAIYEEISENFGTLIQETIDESLEYYKNGQIIEITKLISDKGFESDNDFQQSYEQLIKRLGNLQNLAYATERTAPDLNSIIEAITTETKQQNHNQNLVKICNIKNTIQTKYLYILGLTNNSYPKELNTTEFLTPETNIKISKFLKEKNNAFDYIISTPENVIKESAHALIKALEKSETATVCTHKYEEKKQTQPSVFFQYLSNFYEIQNIDFSIKTDKKQQQLEIKFNSETNDSVLGNSHINLSPSAILDFQKCPRKFYYANLLGLQKSENFAASYGTIVHTIMELFNKTCLKNYTKTAILELTDILFNAVNNPETALTKGFDENIIALIQATDFLSLEEMKTNFLNAIDELEQNKFFEKVPISVISEQSFGFTLKEIPDVTFIGRIDAIYEYENKFKLIDFKTGKDLTELSKLICEKGITLVDENGEIKEKAVNEFLYQIPIYYLACENAPELKHLMTKPAQFGLLYVRPKSKGGYKTDFVTKEQTVEFIPQIIENLKTTIIDKIRNQKTFECKFDEYGCKSCGFESLCDKESGENYD